MARSKNYEEYVSYSTINADGEIIDYGLHFWARAKSIQALENRVDREIKKRRVRVDKRGLDVDDVEWSDPYEIDEEDLWRYHGELVREE